MDYYVGGLGRTATFILRDGKGRRVARVVGGLEGYSPFTPEQPTGAADQAYPSYEIITVDGITEIIEHRRMEPIFYVTDDVTANELRGIR